MVLIAAAVDDDDDDDDDATHEDPNLGVDWLLLLGNLGFNRP